MRCQQSGHPLGHFLGQPVGRAVEHLEAVGSGYIATAQAGRGPGHEAVAIAPHEQRGTWIRPVRSRRPRGMARYQFSGPRRAAGSAARAA